MILDAENKPVELARRVLDAGVRLVQYRAKTRFDDRQAAELRRLTRERGALFIINDDWQAALATDADGVHVGPDDVPLERLSEIRDAMGEAIVGYSCGTEEEARRAEAAGADYAGVGSVFATPSKSDAGEPIGVIGLHKIAAATRLPVAAIGGITAGNLAAVRKTGVAMAAMIGAIANAKDARAAAAELVRIWDDSKHEKIEDVSAT